MDYNDQDLDDFDEEYLDEDEFGPDDYGFIIGPDGTLKSIVYPEDLMESPPEEVQLILRLYGIDDYETLEGRTLH